MSDRMTVLERRILLTLERAERLSRLARARAISENEVVARALDILFGFTELLDEQADARGWSLLAEASLERVWDNDDDAAYDNWRELYPSMGVRHDFE